MALLRSNLSRDKALREILTGEFTGFFAATESVPVSCDKLVEVIFDGVGQVMKYPCSFPDAANETEGSEYSVCTTPSLFVTGFVVFYQREIPRSPALFVL